MDSMKSTFLKIMRSRVTHVLKFMLVIFGVVLFVIRGGERMGYNWQWYQIPKYIFSYDNGKFVSGPLLDGLMITFRITGVSLVLAFTIGLVATLFRLSNSILARTLARVYVELIRNTPLLVQLFFISGVCT